MTFNFKLSRRALLAGLAASPFAGSATPVFAAESLPPMTVAKDPSCGCCGAWVDHVRAAGFLVEVVETPQMNRVKARLGVPQDLASCHTAEIGGYVIEGHVPAEMIKSVLSERPQAKGLAVAGMPVGSPGMEVEGVAPDIYEVVMFGPAGRKTFARYQGVRRI
jgi:hypothetical protein